MSYPPDQYTAEQGAVSAIFKPATNEPDLRIGEVSSTTYLATGATTQGQFGLYRWDMGPQPAGPAAHLHRSITESFFILQGEVRLYNGEQWITASAGDFLYVPQGGIHAFRNESGAPASMLLLFTPGAPREAYFEALAESASSGRPLSREDLLRLWLEHDTYPA